MSTKWVAGSTRAGAIANRRLGRAATAALAGSGSLSDAVEVLATSPYGRFVHVGDTLATAQHGVAQTLLWNLRVLAGWVPVDGVRMLRLFAGWFEIANVDEHLRGLTRPDPVDPPFRLGTLATAWPRLAMTSSVSELRDVLGTSPWGGPGGDSPRDFSLTLHLAWADRLAAGVPAAQSWTIQAAALLVAREAAAGRRLPDRAQVAAARLLGRDWARDSLPGLTDATDLWRAEALWWSRLRTEGRRMLVISGFGPSRLVGAVAMLAADAWQVRAALEAAARGAAAREVFDAVA